MQNIEPNKIYSETPNFVSVVLNKCEWLCLESFKDVSLKLSVVNGAIILGFNDIFQDDKD